MFISPAILIVVLALGKCPFTGAHMIISLPSTWGLSSDLETPLTNDVQDWFCHGQSRDTNVITTITAGSTFSAPIVCGEAYEDPENGAEICTNDSDGTNDYHSGGGCALSIAYTSSPDIEDFVMFSVNHDCPSPNQAIIDFEVPDNLPSGSATCSWTWIPPSSASQDEMYMNCFNCKIVGNTGVITSGEMLKDHLHAVPLAGVSNSGDRGLYEDVFSEGALEIVVDGSSTTTTDEEETPTETSTDDEETPTTTRDEETSTETSTDEETSTTTDDEETCTRRKRGGRRGRHGKNRRNRRNKNRTTFTDDEDETTTEIDEETSTNTDVEETGSATSV